MGAYLPKPITKKVSSDQVGKNLDCGASSMQGWRMNQEDAHNCCIDFDDDASLFAVYDGHGGHEVATYCSQKLPEFIKNTEAYAHDNECSSSCAPLENGEAEQQEKISSSGRRRNQMINFYSILLNKEVDYSDDDDDGDDENDQTFDG